MHIIQGEYELHHVKHPKKTHTHSSYWTLLFPFHLDYGLDAAHRVLGTHAIPEVVRAYGHHDGLQERKVVATRVQAVGGTQTVRFETRYISTLLSKLGLGPYRLE